jgi:hypothetical protein
VTRPSSAAVVISIGAMRRRLSLGIVVVLWWPWPAVAAQVGLASAKSNQSRHLTITGDVFPHVITVMNIEA